jgi:hypothetical protein
MSNQNDYSAHLRRLPQTKSDFGQLQFMHSESFSSSSRRSLATCSSRTAARSFDTM